ncbi:hypothetical protein ASPWEDRAFT_71351 [Aspergillus wentii DTO 134E9]|uniref:Uncharacterized protein n=1 Tax=Aspergillus wentii DTO 134E9 TaxID=1073089 RepID=A0A1L9RAR2_ASPWE|nr:uncharacterized protein ASPWEDRAFT_71351 [Aspergillus wentii DTO 134E9]OJJ31999.1 hypothetical protein ASPWEDRAFT_71351 [Aspergillus wentii DTO 134E9]
MWLWDALLAFLATLFGVFIILAIIKTDILWEIDAYLRERSSRRRHILNNSMTIKSWIANNQEFDAFLQREVYLLENREMLKPKAASGSLSQNQEKLLGKIEGELKQRKRHLWTTCQGFSKLQSGITRGVYIEEFCRQIKTAEQTRKWSIDRRACQLRQDCCDRGCGCCKRPRRAPGQTEAFAVAD